MTILKVTDDTTRAELAEAITNVNVLAKRCPAHYADEWTKWHRQINALLCDWERACS